MTRTEQLQRLDAARRRVAGTLTAVMIVMYSAFILLIAYAKALLTRTVVPGLSVGILLGVLVILVSWLLIWIYARWANTHYDTAIANLRADA
jgi:uncharacterized membrane protein (DUF485 family)